jgi:L-ascorbate metabolism protein UlaG (beta-lactamase superfamily)
MPAEHLYLKQNIQVEPLVDRWYAWPHLIPPATASRNFTERHLRIIDSYIQDPEIHASAVRNPRMLGGPFMDYEHNKVDEIRSLKQKILKERHSLIDLSSAIEKLDALLRDKAKGASLHGLYPQVPPILRGYVELVYDLNNNPSFRLIEPLIYKSGLYDRTQQTIMLSHTNSDDRPFILSTPRLDSDESIHFEIDFAHDSIDKLFKLKHEPQTWSTICEFLPVNPSSSALLRSFLTAEQPPLYQPYKGSGVRWRYFGHACILIEYCGKTLLFDPVLSYTYESDISRYTYLDLPDEIDYVLITHNHQDHVLFETLLQIRHRTKNIIVPRNGNGHLQDPSLKLTLENCGFRNVIEVSEMEELILGDIRILALPFFGEHADLDISTKMAWLITLDNRKLMFAADSCNIEPKLYEHIARDCGKIDALFLGMECDGAPLSWLYGPLLTKRLDRTADESRRLSGSDGDQGLNIVNAFAPEQLYVYAMGQEPWLNYIMSIKYTEQSRPIVESNRLIKVCQARGITAERLFGEKEILLGE